MHFAMKKAINHSEFLVWSSDSCMMKFAWLLCNASRAHLKQKRTMLSVCEDQHQVQIRSQTIRGLYNIVLNEHITQNIVLCNFSSGYKNTRPAIILYTNMLHCYLLAFKRLDVILFLIILTTDLFGMSEIVGIRRPCCSLCNDLNFLHDEA